MTETVGITERAAHRIVSELAAAGYIARRRNGRRNHYTIRSEAPNPVHKEGSLPGPTGQEDSNPRPLVLHARAVIAARNE